MSINNNYWNSIRMKQYQHFQWINVSLFELNWVVFCSFELNSRNWFPDHILCTLKEMQWWKGSGILMFPSRWYTQSYIFAVWSCIITISNVIKMRKYCYGRDEILFIQDLFLKIDMFWKFWTISTLHCSCVQVFYISTIQCNS